MDKPNGTGLRKRQQIVKANQLMFLWIVGVSAIVGFSLVLVVFLAQRIWFGEKVIAEKDKTISTLNSNLETIPRLQDNVRVLNTNQALQSVRLNDNESALQVVLDALPADANSTAMASSLQTKLLTGVPGVTIDALRIDPASDDDISGAIGFSFTVSAANSDQDALRTVLRRIERSIRPFTIETLSIEGQSNRLIMSVTGYGYYEPAQTVDLENKVVRP